MRKLLFVALVQCTSIPDPCAAEGSCVPADSPGVPPPSCDANLDPKDAPSCVADGFAYFVSATGREDGDGTKAHPLRSLPVALAKADANRRSRIYVCEGSYPEPFAAGVSVFGGFECNAWTYTGRKAIVGPLRVERSRDVRLADLRVEAPSAGAPGASSIAARLNASTVTMLRMELVAGSGANGADGPNGAAEPIITVSSGALNADGNTSADAKAKTCTCASGTVTIGGAGGHLVDTGLVASGGQPGSAGAPGQNTGMCRDTQFLYPQALGFNGSPGADAPPLLTATKVGVLAPEGWTPSLAPDGTRSGAVGQGGGGGGARTNGTRGGGGACGGCGGSPGKGGHGGGASIALASFASTVTLIAVSLATGTAGNGGAGGKGGDGAPGGKGGDGDCSGGDGGNGGRGSDAPGGPGGLSAGIVWVGEKPSYDPNSTTFQLGPAGAGGPGGHADNGGRAGLQGNDLQGPEL